MNGGLLYRLENALKPVSRRGDAMTAEPGLVGQLAPVKEQQKGFVMKARNLWLLVLVMLMFAGSVATVVADKSVTSAAYWHYHSASATGSSSSRRRVA